MHVHVLNQQHALAMDLQQIAPLVTEILTFEEEACDEVSVYFVETPTICQLHQDYFNDPSPTDCISFPLDAEEDGLNYRVLGEVFICPETAIKYAAEHQLDPYEETTLYLVHALLHLIGYDDIEEEDRQAMREAEQRHLVHLRQLNLLLHP